MCRWVVYSGESLRLSTLILDTPHSLVAQSLNSPLGKETVNGDGFGVGWYPTHGTPGGAPALFRSVEPAWYDENLSELGRPSSRRTATHSATRTGCSCTTAPCASSA